MRHIPKILQCRDGISPAFSDETNAIAIVSSDEYFPMASVLIRSIIVNMADHNKYDILILSDSPTAENIRLITGMADGITNLSLRVVDMSGYLDNITIYTTTRYPHLLYYRVLLYSVLCEYGKVLSLDADTIVRTDISQLFEIELGDKCALVAHEINAEIFSKYNEFGVDNKFDCIRHFNSGVMLFDVKKCLEMKLQECALELISNYQFPMLDQDVLNILLHDKALYLGYEWCLFADVHYNIALYKKCMCESNFNELVRAWEDPKIIHYIETGEAKPWFDVNREMASEFWQPARKSPFYEKLLALMLSYSSKIETISESIPENVYLPIVDRYKHVGDFVSQEYPLVIWGTLYKSVACYQKLLSTGAVGTVDVFFCDNNEKRHNHTIDGVPVKSPLDLQVSNKKYKFIIPIRAYREVITQLQSLELA